MTTTLVPTHQPLVITGYQIAVESDEPVRSLVVDVGAEVTSFTVPTEFFAAGATYRFEVAAIEAGGNLTVSEGTFLVGEVREERERR